MKCEYCGKELPAGANFCDGCGAKFESKNVNNVNSNSYQEASNVQPNYNAQQPYYGAPKKSGTGLKVTIAILVVVIVALLGVGAWFLFFGGDDSEESSNSEKDNVEDKVDNKKDDNDDNDDNDDDEKPNYGNLEEVTLGDYTLSVPKGFDTGTEGGKPYIYNDDCLIMYIEYPLDYNTLLERKDVFIDELENSGMEIYSFDTKKIDGKKFILVEGVMTASNAEFAYMFTDLDDDKLLFLTIVSSNLGDFDEDWYEYGAEFAKSVR